MKHDINTELCELGKRYHGGHISLEKYRAERRAVIDKLATKNVSPPKRKSSKLAVILFSAGLAFLAAYWFVFKII